MPVFPMSGGVKPHPVESVERKSVFVGNMQKNGLFRAKGPDLPGPLFFYDKNLTWIHFPSNFL